MYIEAITVCVNYSDFLAYTLPLNKQHFDHWVIITSKEDRETQQLCKHYNVECLVTDRFTEDGSPFNKAKGVNEGLLYHSKRDWMLHIDADIVLPPTFRQIVERMTLDVHSIYGVDRLMCPDFSSWMAYIQKPKTIYDNWIYIHLDAFPIAARVADYNGDGYAPIGYFQLWHPQKSKQLLYPEEHGAADRTDMAFAKRWKRENRHLMAEIVCIHLDSENATVKSTGKNWQGRKTIPFGYEGTPAKKEKHFKNHLKTAIVWTIFLLLGVGVAYAISNSKTILSLLNR